MTAPETVLPQGPPPPVPRRPPPPAGGRVARWGGASLVVLVVAWSVAGTDIGLGSLLEGRQAGLRMLRSFLTPDLSGEFLAVVASAAVETVQISVSALLLCVLLGLPLAALIAGNVRAPRPVAATARVVAAGLRGIPELLWALLFVATVGPGPAAGVYAIALHGAGLLAKLCSEQLEAVDPAPVEALRLTGASRSATALLATVPQARSGIASLVLYQWECNIRAATIVGLVSAGGIGQDLVISLKLFRYSEAGTLVLAIVAIILAVDFFSRLVRRRLGAAS
ncbi:MAG TPA: phosphonate ABC transporter, permease protein PhnE [Egibacteraceae bacterium]|nr:phosphonate ABC transporter, permease protein PhnE [Egibacteraceae bacterium]